MPDSALTSLGPGWWLALIALLVVPYALMFVYVHRRRRRRLEDLDQLLAQPEFLHHDFSARIVGHRRGPRRAFVARGVLSLSATALRFDWILPERALTVALDAIENSLVRRHFRGRGVFGARKLLVVQFRDANGRPDAAAFYINDPARWVEAITLLKGGEEAEQALGDRRPDGDAPVFKLPNAPAEIDDPRN